MENTDVRRDVGRHITTLGLNDGEGSERTSTEGVVHLGGTLEETRVEDCEKRVEVSEGVDGVPLKDVGGSASDLLSPAAISLLECSRKRKVEVLWSISSMRRWLRLAVRGSRAG